MFMNNVVIEWQWRHAIKPKDAWGHGDGQMTKLNTLLRISTMSVALLSASAVATVLIAPDIAYAGKGNDNGNGGNGNGGNGNGKSNAGGAKADKSDAKGKSAAAKGKSDKASSSRGPKFSLKGIFGGEKKERAAKPKRSVVKKVAKSRAPTEAPAPAPKPKRPTLADTLGVHPSELGALNAAHASPQALANASPNSRVGKLAIYMGEVIASRELQAELDAAQAVLAALDEPARSIEDVDLALATAKTERSDLQSQVDALTAELAQIDGGDDAIEGEITTLNEAIAAKDGEISDLEQERADGVAYAEALSTVEELEGELETQGETQRSALEAAANKEVTDEVEAAVQMLLGIYEEPESVEENVVEGDVVEEVATLE